MRPWLVPTLLLGFAVQPTAYAQPATTVQPGERLAGVSFGGDHLPLARLRDAIAARAGDLVSTIDLAGDRDALRTTLVAAGYLDATVDPAALTHTDAGAFAWFAVHPGRLYRIGRIHIVNPQPGRTPIVTVATGDDARAASLADAQAIRVTPDRVTATVDVDVLAR
jgi:hypothetical protein